MSAVIWFLPGAQRLHHDPPGGGNNINCDMVLGMWEVVYLPEAEDERADLPARDRVAVDNAVAKLEAMGPALPHPHSSNVEGWTDLRELRPQAGKSPWRPLYLQVGTPFVIAAIGPEAKKDKRGFDRTCQHAIDRLAKLEEDDEEQGPNQEPDETATQPEK
jgi:hypothetical protein